MDEINNFESGELESGETLSLNVPEKTTLSLDVVTTDANNLVQQLIEDKSNSKFRDLTQSFRINQAKKSMIRTLKLDGLYDHISDEALIRLQNHPEEITNVELLNYMKTVQEAINDSDEALDKITKEPEGRFPTTQTNIQINSLNEPVAELDSESRARILNSIDDFMKMMKKDVDLSTKIVHDVAPTKETTNEEIRKDEK